MTPTIVNGTLLASPAGEVLPATSGAAAFAERNRSCGEQGGDRARRCQVAKEVVRALALEGGVVRGAGGDGEGFCADGAGSGDVERRIADDDDAALGAGDPEAGSASFGTYEQKLAPILGVAAEAP